MVDVIVVGAGPAGAATAALLAERGVSVLVLDRARFPRPKVCGEYLSPGVLPLLDRLGVLKAVDQVASPLAGMRITAPGGTTVVGTYRAVGPWRPYREHALAVQRETLDAVLVERFRSLPLEFREEVRVTGLLCDGSGVVGVETVGRHGRHERIPARLVIGADGRASVVAGELGCRRSPRLRRMALVTYITPPADCAHFGEIFVDPPDYAILNPVAPGRVNLSVVVPLDHAAPWSSRLEQFLAARVRQFRHLSHRLAGTEVIAPVRAMGPLEVRVEPPRADGVLLVGDAAGFYDPFTGEGVFAALKGAELAARVAAPALAAGDVTAETLGEYERMRRATFRAKQRLVHVLQIVVGQRRLADLTARVLLGRPHLMDRLLGVVGDYVPARALLGLGRSRRSTAS